MSFHTYVSMSSPFLSFLSDEERIEMRRINEAREKARLRQARKDRARELTKKRMSEIMKGKA